MQSAGSWTGSGRRDQPVSASTRSWWRLGCPARALFPPHQGLASPHPPLTCPPVAPTRQAHGHQAAESGKHASRAPASRVPAAACAELTCLVVTTEKDHPVLTTCLGCDPHPASALTAPFLAGGRGDAYVLKRLSLKSSRWLKDAGCRVPGPSPYCAVGGVFLVSLASVSL